MVTCLTLGVRLGSSVTEVAPDPIRATLASLASSDCYINAGFSLELQTNHRQRFHNLGDEIFANLRLFEAPMQYQHLIISSHFSSHSWGWTMRPWNLSWPGSAGRCGFS